MNDEHFSKFMSQSSTVKVCENCGEKFECRSESQDCWCFQVNLDKENLKNLNDKFNDCLCENCLNDVGISEIKN